MGKKTVFTRITPLPKNVPRQLALDMLHSHEEVIRLNPLVTDVKPVAAPREAPSEEYFSSWYEIFETVTVGLGYKKKISFKTVFHNHPWGCQTHSYAPFGVDLRNKYRVGGNQPGEPREVKELGVETPLDGLYIREDVEIICNIPLTTNFVRKETKEAIGVMVDRISRKAELLDEGKLHAMFENGMLKTSKPNMDATFEDRPMPSPGGSGGSPPGSPSPSHHSRDTFSTHGGLRSPPLDSKGFGRYRDIAREGSVREGSVRSSQYVPSYQQSGYGGPQRTNAGAELPAQSVPTAFMSELPASTYFIPQEQQQQQARRSQQYPEHTLYPQPLKPGGGGAVFRSELPGDTQMPSQQQPQQPPRLPQDYKPQQQPPESQHPANASNRSSQQNSPALQPQPLTEPNREQNSSQSNSNSYRVANPDQHRPDSGGSGGNVRPNAAARHSSSNVQQWQVSVQSDPVIQDSYYRNARSSQGDPTAPSQQPPSSLSQLPSQQQQQPQQQQQRASWQQQQPDHQRFARMSMQGAQNGGVARSSKCPVCGMFEGDEVAGEEEEEDDDDDDDEGTSEEWPRQEVAFDRFGS